MEFLKALLVHLPSILATLILAIAALLKAGKERGSILLVLGAIGLFIQSLVNPILFIVILPKLISNGASTNLYGTVSAINTLLWAGSLLLIAIGTFIRKPASR